MKVGEETSLRCEGDGSPEPQFEWQQKLDDGDTSMVMVRRRETVLNIRSVSECCSVEGDDRGGKCSRQFLKHGGTGNSH